MRPPVLPARDGRRIEQADDVLAVIAHDCDDRESRASLLSGFLDTAPEPSQ
jgi:hypothetical protein